MSPPVADALEIGTRVLIYVYLFAVIVGGVLLGASILLGGHDAHGDGEVGDADADQEIGGHGEVSGFLLTFLSLRFWTFFLAFFGMTGLALDLLGLIEQPPITLAIALAMGLLTGFGATALIRLLGSDTSGKAVESSDYVGKTARVVVPIGQKSVGKVRVEVKGNAVDLLATGLEDEETYDGREEVVIVEMDGTRARVARLEPKKAREHG